MRVFSEEVIAVIDVSTGSAAAAVAVKKLSESHSVTFPQSGDTRSVVILDGAGGKIICFSNLGADTVRQHLNSDGFIFI